MQNEFDVSTICLVIYLGQAELESMKQKHAIYFDGGVHNKRVVVVDVSTEIKVRVWEDVNTCSKTHGKISNELECFALLKALEYLYAEYGAAAVNVVIYGDNLIGVKGDRLAGGRREGASYLEPLHRICNRKLTKFSNPVELKWVSRNKNLAGHVLEMMYKVDLRLNRLKSGKTVLACPLIFHFPFYE